jgi:hypothetical protein
MSPKTNLFKELISDLNIDESKTKKIINTKIRKQYNSVLNNVPFVKNWNMQADLLELPHYDGYKYLFVICDLASGQFDIEPMKTKQSKEALEAMEKCFERNFVKKPKYSIQTDGGNEFKSVFQQYLYNNSILHKLSIPDRHKQQSVVESLNRQLGRLFNGVMNKKEVETGEINRNWIDSIDTIRTKLNAIRKRKTVSAKQLTLLRYPEFNPTEEITTKKKVKGKTVVTKELVFKEPKFEIGDMVYYKLEAPETALGVKQKTKNFREGDSRISQEKRKIVNIFYMHDKPYYRYYLDGIRDASYSDWELIK